MNDVHRCRYSLVLSRFIRCFSLLDRLQDIQDLSNVAILCLKETGEPGSLFFGLLLLRLLLVIEDSPLLLIIRGGSSLLGWLCFLLLLSRGLILLGLLFFLRTSGGL